MEKFVILHSIGMIIKVKKRHKDHRGTTHTIHCLLCYEMSSTLLKLKCYGFHLSRHGAHISQAYSPYFL